MPYDIDCVKYATNLARRAVFVYKHNTRNLHFFHNARKCVTQLVFLWSYVWGGEGLTFETARHHSPMNVTFAESQHFTLEAPLANSQHFGTFCCHYNLMLVFVVWASERIAFIGVMLRCCLEEAS